MLWRQTFYGLTHHIFRLYSHYGITVPTGSPSNPPKYPCPQEETKKQEHSLRNDLFNVLLVFALQRISVTRCLHQISHMFEIL